MNDPIILGNLLRMNKGIYKFADQAAAAIAKSDWAEARLIYGWINMQVEVIRDAIRAVEQKERQKGCNCKPRYINEDTQEEGREHKTCETCKHGRRFDEQAMLVCETHLIVDPMYVCCYYKKRGGEK